MTNDIDLLQQFLRKVYPLKEELEVFMPDLQKLKAAEGIILIDYF